MGYLIADDFKKAIQADNLQQVINKDLSILDAAIADASQTVKEYLIQKFVLDNELADTTLYDKAISYTPGQRVYLDATSYDASAGTYVLGDLTLQAGNIYKCTTAIAAPEAFTSSHWQLLGIQFQIYNIALPYPLFVLNKYYKKGDIVFWNGKSYTCQINSTAYAHEVILQNQTYATVPPPNIFPDDPINGLQYWGAGVATTIAAGQLPTGWTKGDNRNPSLVRHCVAIGLWIVHFRIAPRNVPESRDIAYRGKTEDRVATRDGIVYPDYCALGWLQAAARGNITSGLTPIQPRSGGALRWGSQIKRVNDY